MTLQKYRCNSCMISTMFDGLRISRHWILLPAILLSTSPAMAGMPYPPTLTDLSRLRVEAISFFLFILLASAGLIRVLWNGLRGSFPRLPKLSYVGSIGLVMLWGLLFIVVLAMISGARELMTPGAWEKQGATYRLTGEGK